VVSTTETVTTASSEIDDSLLEKLLREVASSVENEASIPLERLIDAVDPVVREQWPRVGEIYTDVVRLRNQTSHISEERTGRQRLRRRTAAVFFLGLVLLGGAGWLVLSFLPSSPALILVTVGLTSALAMYLSWLRIRLKQGRRLNSVLQEAKRSLDLRTSQLRDVLENAVYAAIRARAAPPTTLNPAEDQVAFTPTSAPSAKADAGQLIPTDASARLAYALARRHGAAVGLAGPRGVGKTALARRFTVDRPDREAIGVFLPAPVAYEIPLFLHALLKEVCISVIREADPLRRLPYEGMEEANRRYGRLRLQRLIARVPLFILMPLGLGLVATDLTHSQIPLRPAKWLVGIVLAWMGGLVSGIAFRAFQIRQPDESTTAPRWSDEAGNIQIPSQGVQYAEALKQRIEYTQRTTVGGELSGSFKGVGVKGSRSLELSRLPVTEVDVPRELGQLVDLVGRRVVIAIDELDKMPSDDDAIQFLNRIKVLFPIPNCSFIVSVSESAWARFETRGLPFRDAFDSSLDDVLHLDLLRPIESRDMLRGRNAEISDLQALFCHCFSGGLPRDLLRAARDVANWASEAASRDLPTVAEMLLAQEVHSKVLAARHRLRNYPSMLEHREILDEVHHWRDQWASPDHFESFFRRSIRLTDPVESSRRIDAQTDKREALAVESIRQQLGAYLAFLQTIRQAFAADGPIAGLPTEAAFQDGPFADALGLIVGARDLLSTDVSGAVLALDHARAQLKLAPMNPMFSSQGSGVSHGPPRPLAHRDRDAASPPPKARREGV
jgi:hypothetical protein